MGLAPAHGVVVGDQRRLSGPVVWLAHASAALISAWNMVWSLVLTGISALCSLSGSAGWRQESVQQGPPGSALEREVW